MAKKQKDGRYRAKITIGNGADGNPIHKYVSGRTQRELEDAKVAARAHYVEGLSQRKDILFGVYAQQWYTLSKEPGISESSKRNYKTMLNNHIFPVFADRNLRAIAPKDLQEWLNQFAGSGKSTIDQAATCIRSIFTSAFHDGYINKDPSIRLVLPKASKPQKKRALTPEERERILLTANRHEEGFYLAVLYYLGLRRGEALGLKWGDIEWENKLVHVQRDIDFVVPANEAEGDLKSEESDRKVIIPDALLPILKAKRAEMDTFIFTAEDGKALSKASSERMWIRLMIDAGFAVPKERTWKHKDIRAYWDPVITPHYLRHNYITMLWEGGVDPVVAMRLVGHKDYHTTVQIYTHLDKTHLRDTDNKINTVFKKLPESCQEEDQFIPEK